MNLENLDISKMKGNYLGNLDSVKFNQWVITGPIQGGSEPWKRIGRVVQVRKEAGQFGSDLVFVRHLNGTLCTHANQSFYRVIPHNLPKLEELYGEAGCEDLDSLEETYTIEDEFPETGFIIPSKVPEGESTPMRDIKGKLISAIADRLEES